MNRPALPAPAAFGKVAVLFGGTSAERDVSLRSGKAVLEALQRSGVDAHGIDAVGDFLQTLKTGGYARVWNAVHGRGGEDGQLQGALQLLGLPCTGSGVGASALAMDKMRAKQLWQGIGLSTPPFQMVTAAMVATETDAQAVFAKLGPILMVKPAHEGSSVGMAKVRTAIELQQAVIEALKYDASVIVERFVSGPEYTVGIVGDEVLPSISMETPRDFYDYQAKYHSGGTTQYHCPSGLSAADEAELGALAKWAFDSLGCKGWSRVDVMRDGSNQQFYVLEVNTVPGMTETSLVPKAAKVAGMSFEQLVQQILLPTLAQ
ncbi:D-alanine--D-alanine ligase [Permianibacter sp. IMCC34836]|uniref:D-alanine--D-alanine ligase n=1 Tax=Permianibacter fluminis TaxID=2738515 RepID=UPI0015564ACE|nr:D-alanine--D-alanine ligase [Permianibacter fluminis]NQD37016.1 D-alanine--D-alanine ligase [Permianibacter fluminis]